MIKGILKKIFHFHDWQYLDPKGITCQARNCKTCNKFEYIPIRHIHNWKFRKEWGITYQQFECTLCGERKIIDQD